MKTPTIPHEKKSRATAAVRRTSSSPRRPSKKTGINFLGPENKTFNKPVLLLPERFPNPDKVRLCFGLYAPDAQAVFVAGSFNDWHPSATPLQKFAGGQWSVELMLEPGRHEYRFVVDGQWTNDPLSSAYVSNPFGDLNCIVVATIQG